MFLTGKISTEGIARRLWRLLYVVAWRDSEGRVWAVPVSFLFDKVSSPFIFWWFCPPSAVSGDRAAAIHDFMCRCRELLGISQSWIDREFRRTNIADGISSKQSAARAAFVWVAGQLNPAKGKGVHANKKYNGPVEWGAKKYPMLADFVREHYDPNGGGLRKWVLDDMGWGEKK